MNQKQQLDFVIKMRELKLDLFKVVKGSHGGDPALDAIKTNEVWEVLFPNVPEDKK